MVHPNQYSNDINQLSASEKVPSESFNPFLKFDLSQRGSGVSFRGLIFEKYDFYVVKDGAPISIFERF